MRVKDAVLARRHYGSGDSAKAVKSVARDGLAARAGTELAR